MSLLESVPDPRKPRGLRHRLPAILAVGIAAVAAGARSFVAIGAWAAGLDEATLSTLGLTGSRVPSESAIRRTLALSTPPHWTARSGCGCGPAPAPSMVRPGHAG
jgi:hypothetical protein